jgi:hypothetical protein
MAGPRRQHAAPVADVVGVPRMPLAPLKKQSRPPPWFASHKKERGRCAERRRSARRARCSEAGNDMSFFAHPICRAIDVAVVVGLAAALWGCEPGVSVPLVAPPIAAASPARASPATPAPMSELARRDDIRDSTASLPPDVDGPVHFVVSADENKLAEALRRSGAHDLACPAESLTLKTVTVHTFSELYAADGCGQRAVYVLEHWDMSERGGNWLARFFLISRVTLAPPRSS